MEKHILVRPYITEKTMNLASRGWYSFVVAMNATKAEIEQAVHVQYKVTVISVRTSHMHGKVKRVGKRQKPVARHAWKKAMVELKEGETIEAFQIGEQEKK